MSRFDIVSPRPRKNSDKPYWHRVGTAFEGERGLSLVFDSLPLPDNEGRVVVKLFEQRDDRSGARDRKDAQDRAGQQPVYRDLDDEIPF